MAKSTLKDLHDHLKASGTGQAKLDVVTAASTVTEAVDALAEQYPGTHAKALAFLADAEPEQEQKPEPAKGGRGKAKAETKPEEDEPAKGE